ncbi:MAG: PEP-CTERM sorting domain-containing protein [Acidobacteriota bacterium]|nr:PEP-CTERM sorting domain-containing protein [Acidobacteriota bacterium]
MDPVVARHYSDFDLAKIRRVTLNTPQMMYVSYRIGNNVLWTRHKMTLPKGETMLTDGNLMARTRCGNRVSAVPISPNALVEPAAEEFNAPTFAPLSTPYLAAYPALRAAFPSGLGTQPTGRSISPSTPIAPFFPLPGGGGGGSSPPPVVPIPAPIGVPEPGTAGLVLVGLGATWLMRRNRKAR